MAKLDRREFTKMTAAATVLGSAFHSSGAFAAPEAAASTDLSALTMTEAASRLRTREITSVALVNACLNRIALLDSKINSYITVMREKALRQAEAMDEEAKGGT
jgi:aspartyl-tRNA(Asn)/glutamyl-tRNA(Gln) amidotransferase subunit A